MKRRSSKRWFAFAGWAASIVSAWPVLSGTLFPRPDRSGIGPFWCGTFLPPPTVLELLASRHRPWMPRPFFRIRSYDSFPAWTRQPDGRVVVDARAAPDTGPRP
jgi:hypothetical protein